MHDLFPCMTSKLLIIFTPRDPSNLKILWDYIFFKYLNKIKIITIQFKLRKLIKN